MQENFKKINFLNWLGNFFVALAILVVLFFLTSKFLPQFSYNLVVIKTGSMEPIIKKGSVVLIKKVGEYQENDIITFQRNDQDFITHRIVRIIENDKNKSFETKGDNNNSVDVNLVKESEIIGKKIFSIGLVGYLLIWLKQDSGKNVLIGFLVILAIYLIFSEFSKIKRELKKKNL